MLYVSAIILGFKKCETQHIEYVKNRAQNYWCVSFLILRKCKTQQVNYNEKTELKVLQAECFLLNFYIFSNKMQHYLSHFLKVFDLK